MNITEDCVSFEVAKLLKEKGFDEICSYEWGVPDIDKGYVLQKWAIYNCQIKNSELIEDAYAAPTLQMAMKWLRKKHNILITIIPQEIKVGIDALCYDIYRITEDLYQPLYNGKVDNLVDSYEEAVEAALKYSLENLENLM